MSKLFLPLQPVQRGILIGGFALFLFIVMLGAAHPPIIANYDMLNVSLLVLNREEQMQFGGDLAMRAGTWWAYYTPAYLTILRLGHRLTGSLETVYLLLTLGAYLGLLTGFYALGRHVGLRFHWTLLLALLGSLYHQSALGLSWTGAGSEMAAARNLYLALTGWLVYWGLTLLKSHREHPRLWLLYGVVLGLLSNLHSLTGLFFIALISIGIVGACVFNSLSWKALVAFAFGACPGVLFVYQTTIAPIDALYVEGLRLDAAWQTSVGFTSGYQNLARAELLGLRLTNWQLPIALYTATSAITGVGLIGTNRRQNPPTLSGLDFLWSIFGLVQLYGAMLLLTLDWLVLMAGGLWLLYNRRDPRTRGVLIVLSGVGVLALPIGYGAALLGESGLLPIGYGAARLLMRGGQFAYPAIILMLLLAAQGMIRPCPRPERLERILLLVSILLMGILAQRDPAQFFDAGWLVPDGWLLLGIALLVGWHLVRRWEIVRAVGITLFIGQLIARIVIAPPALRNWSFTNAGSVYYNAADAGAWLRQNTPAGSVIASDETFLRLYTLRPQIGGAEDAGFLREDQAQFERFTQLNREFNAALNLTETLRTFCTRYAVDYLVVRVDRTLETNAFILVYTNDRYRIYQVLE